MYPYLADFDSDGYDDIEAGEEDNFVKWDPINGVHVPRETPLVLTKQYKAEGEYVAAPGDNGPAQLLQGEIDPKTFLGADEELITIPEKDVPLVQILEDQIGLSILFEAAKTVSENGQTEKNDLDDGDMPGPSEKHDDATENKASVISDLVRYIYHLFTTPQFRYPVLTASDFNTSEIKPMFSDTSSGTYCLRRW